MLSFADLGLSGLGLELNFNYWQGGSMPRDLVDVSDLVDHWNILGLPLLAHVSAPCHLQLDSMATAKSEIVSNWRYPNYPWWDQSQMSDSGSFEMPSDAGVPVLANVNAVQTNRERMPVNGLEVMQMLLAKSNVHGIFWNQYSDREDHVYPNAGLVAASGKRRSLLDGLTRLRQLHVH